MIRLVGFEERAGCAFDDDKGSVNVQRKVIKYGLMWRVEFDVEYGNDSPRSVVEEPAVHLDGGILLFITVKLESPGGKAVELKLDGFKKMYVLFLRIDAPSPPSMFELKFSVKVALADVKILLEVRRCSGFSNL